MIKEWSNCPGINKNIKLWRWATSFISCLWMSTSQNVFWITTQISLSASMLSSICIEVWFQSTLTLNWTNLKLLLKSWFFVPVTEYDVSQWIGYIYEAIMSVINYLYKLFSYLNGTARNWICSVYCPYFCLGMWLVYTQQGWTFTWQMTTVLYIKIIIQAIHKRMSVA